MAYLYTPKPDIKDSVENLLHKAVEIAAPLLSAKITLTVQKRNSSYTIEIDGREAKDD